MLIGPALRVVSLSVFSILAVAALLPWEAPARAAAEHTEAEDELQARTLFAQGDYEAARVLYTRLFARSSHPTYLRNIGRCYQKLGEPEHAISSFRDYLRQGRDLSEATRAEIEGAIAEMEALARERAKPAVSPPVEAPAVEALPRPAPPPRAAPPRLTLAPRVTTPAPATTPLVGRWWFWAGVTAAALAATVTIYKWPAGSPGAAP